MANFVGGSRSVNKNVSTSAVSRAEKVLINELRVINESHSKPTKIPAKRSNASFVWQYYGALYHQTSSDSADGNGNSILIDDDRLYCR
jgi:hypothetical protein